MGEGGGRSSGENGRRYRDRFSVDKSKQSIKIFDQFFPSFFLSFFCSVFGVLVGKSLSRRRYRSEGHPERERERERRGEIDFGEKRRVHSVKQ